MSSPADPPKSITQLLNSGSEDALDDAFSEVYGELQRLAQHHLQSERPNHTLSATALVNEAYLKVAAQEKSQWSNRAQFFSVASMAMRRILVNHARDNQRKKRGGGAVRISLDQLGHGEGMMSEARFDEILTVDRLLGGLAEVDDRAARVTECRYFAGYTNEETAEAMGVSVVTVKRSWRLARAWMARELTRDAHDGEASGLGP